jgi:hypothetical protein
MMRLRAVFFAALFPAMAAHGPAKSAVLDSEVVYIGCVEASGSNLPVATSLKPAERGISGYYVLIEPNGDAVRGTLEQVADLGNGAVRLRWTDRHGSGALTIRLSDDQSRFTGYWTDGAGGALWNWWGREGVLSALQTHKCEAKDSA